MIKHSIVLLAVFLFSGIVGGIAGAQDVQTAVVPGASAKLFAIAPETGAVAFGSSTKAVVTLCPKLASDGVIDQSVSRQLGAIPSQIIYKRLDDKGYFFAFCQLNNTVY